LGKKTWIWSSIPRGDVATSMIVHDENRLRIAHLATYIHYDMHTYTLFLTCFISATSSTADKAYSTTLLGEKMGMEFYT
jgi:hypothetical protein